MLAAGMVLYSELLFCKYFEALPLIDIACKFDAPFSFFGISAGTHFIVMHFSYSKPSDVIVKLSPFEIYWYKVN